MIRMILAAIAGIVGGYALGTSGALRRQVRKQLPSGEPEFRLPQIGVEIDIPRSLPELEAVDEAICVCLPSAPSPDESTVAQIRICVLERLYGDAVIWPPIAGDHASIHEMWGIVGYRIRKMMLRGETEHVCRPLSSNPTAPRIRARWD